MGSERADADETLAATARRLLVLPPEDFVAARTAAVRDVRADDRVLATRIGALRKPSPAAWVVNLLAGQDALDDAVALGPVLRAAQAEAEPAQIARLRRERRALVQSLVQAGAELAADAGTTVAGGVRAQVASTIEAGMADPAAGVAFRSGLLVRMLGTVGFERVDLEGAIAVPEAVDLPEPEPAPEPEPEPEPDLTSDPTAEPRGPHHRRRGRNASRASSPDAEHGAGGTDAASTRRRERDRSAAEAAVQQATRGAAAADAALAALEARADAAESRRRELEDRRHELERELRETRRAVTDAVRDAEWVAGERDAAERAAEDARTALDRAEDRRRALDA